MQVDESVRTYGRTVPLRSTVVYGGIPMEPQIKALRGGVEILVATPGRLLDLVGQTVANLGQVEILVLDEADRMLDMGFLPDIQKIIALLPATRQNLMFSATFSDDIRRLSGTILRDPGDGRGRAAEHRPPKAVEQLVYPVDRDRKEALLAHLIRTRDLHQVLVFTRTKLAASRLASRLDREGIDAVAIHSRPLAAGADAGARGLQVGRDPGARRDRRRGPRPRHRGPAGRRQLRAAVEPAGLHPPHRADRPGRGDAARRSRSSASTRSTCCAASSGCSSRRSRGPSRRASCRTETSSRGRSGCAAGHARRERDAPRASQAGPPPDGRRLRRAARSRPRQARSAALDGSATGPAGEVRTLPGHRPRLRRRP